jgi:PD-(D/E)XK nuclease superfamily
MRKWSHSLDVMVRTCPRRVFYTSRYASPTAKKESPRHKSFLLSQALDLPSWRGLLVHSAIQEWVEPSLKKRAWPDFEWVQEQAVALVDKQAEYSRTGKYLKGSRNSDKLNYCVLRVDLLGDGLSSAQLDETKQSVIDALNILEDEHIDLIDRARRSRWVFSEKEIRFHLDEDIFIEAIPDLIFCESNNRGVIVDWKLWQNTGGSAREQLFAYAFSACRSGWWPELQSQNMELIEANLISGEKAFYDITEDDFHDVDDRIFTGMDQLIPIYERAVDDCLPEDFAPAEGPGACQHCSVMEVCDGSYLPKQKAREPISLELFSIRRIA